MTEILSEYADFTDIFLIDLVIKLSKNISINKLIIKFINDKQLFYRPIYTLSQVQLKTLKTYIKIYKTIGFI